MPPLARVGCAASGFAVHEAPMLVMMNPYTPLPPYFGPSMALPAMKIRHQLKNSWCRKCAYRTPLAPLYTFPTTKETNRSSEDLLVTFMVGSASKGVHRVPYPHFRHDEFFNLYSMPYFRSRKSLRGPEIWGKGSVFDSSKQVLQPGDAGGQDQVVQEPVRVPVQAAARVLRELVLGSRVLDSGASGYYIRFSNWFQNHVERRDSRPACAPAWAQIRALRPRKPYIFRANPAF